MRNRPRHTRLAQVERGEREPQAAQPPVAAPRAARVAMGPCRAQAVPQAEAAVLTARAAMRTRVARLSMARPLAGTAARATARATPEATRPAVALQPAAERARAERPRAEAPLRVAPAVPRRRAAPAVPRLRAVPAVPRLRAVPAVAAQARALCLATSSLAPGAKFARRGLVNVRPVAPFAAESVSSLQICRPILPIVGRRVAVLPAGRERLVPRAFAVARPRGRRLVLEDASTYRPIPRTAANALRRAPAGSVRRGSVAR